MKLLVTQLHEGENTFSFDSQKDGWLREVIAQVEKQGYKLQGDMKVDMQLTKLEPDYYLRGKIRFPVEQTCARCADTFRMPIDHAFDVALAHVAHGHDSRGVKSRAEALAEESEELDINFFEGPEIDLSPIVQEQFFLSLPYQSLCKTDCKGICQRCGKNLNAGDCGCPPLAKPNPFSVLQEFKL